MDQLRDRPTLLPIASGIPVIHSGRPPRWDVSCMYSSACIFLSITDQHKNSAQGSSHPAMIQAGPQPSKNA